MSAIRHNARILAVDDDAEALRRSTVEPLVAAGYDVTEAGNSTAAIDEIAGSRFDLLIADMRLPGTTGVELLTEARKAGPDLAVILMTGERDVKAALDAVRSGASELLLKPFDGAELLRAVDSALGKRHDARELSRLRALAPLIRIGKQITSVEHIERLAEQILEVSLEETGADTGSLMLVDDESKSLYMEGSRGLAPEVARSARPRLGEGISGWVAENSQPLKIEAEVPAGVSGSLDRRDVVSSISVPLTITQTGEEKPLTLGVLNVNKAAGKRPFSQSDLDMLTVLCSQVSVVLKSIQLYSNLQTSYLGTVRALASAVDAKDPYTAGHSERVAIYARQIAAVLGLEQGVTQALYDAGHLHDIGKIGIADSILKKPGRLSDVEFTEMRRHPDHSHRILEPIRLPYDIKPMVRHHHERFDGAGYPDGLSGREIPIGARILSVADSFEAMTSDRPYRTALSREKAVAEIRECAGSQFDPEIVDAFLATESALSDVIL